MKSSYKNREIPSCELSKALREAAPAVRRERSQKHTESRWKSRLKTPKMTLLFLLGILFFIAEWFQPTLLGFMHVLLAVIPSVAVDLIMSIKQERKKINLESAFITGLIMAMVLSSSTAWYVTPVLSAIAALSKHVLVNGRKPIFNPAATGLFIGLLVFSTGESWWGGLALSPAPFIAILVAAGYYLTHKVNKFPIVFSFLGSHFLVLLVFSILGRGAPEVYTTPFIQSALFFGFFMATDPPTSPGKTRDQVVFGILIGIISALMYVLFEGLSYLLVGLLTANLWKYAMDKMRSKKKQSSKRGV
ncbi:RnfABCDGE type electron transport complex subunit D [Rossellomorea marisflavi]|uniref:RnfABCDGE type electron transport complex subunit D n=1 Tax=Rossellomorea marisflavi TaxID=189381 RepID=UPI0034580C66